MTKVKLFPIGTDNKQEKLFKDIMQVLSAYRLDKHCDTMSHKYAIDIMNLFDDFANGGKSSDECDGSGIYFIDNISQNCICSETQSSKVPDYCSDCGHVWYNCLCTHED